MRRVALSGVSLDRCADALQVESSHRTGIRTAAFSWGNPRRPISQVLKSRYERVVNILIHDVRDATVHLLQTVSPDRLSFAGFRF